VPAIDSKIVNRVPALFEDVFGAAKTFQLLYRGSRDGFEAAAFHDRCDGHPNTISLILSTNGCIFGGYTPIAWSSRNAYAPDPSLKSWVFTIKNPHNLPPQLFKQKEEANAVRDFAIHGPAFGNGWDLHICDKCRTSVCYANVGTVYANETGIAATEVLTGSQTFYVEEIEVFEVI
jgi:hypothetical protein